MIKSILKIYNCKMITIYKFQNNITIDLFVTLQHEMQQIKRIIVNADYFKKETLNTFW